MDRFRCLQAFVATADASSITRAARALKTSKSVVSDRLSQLEQLVGHSLIARTTRTVTLTEAGLALYKDFALTVSQLADLENTRTTDQLSLKGSLRVTSSIDVGLEEIASAVAATKQRHPALIIELVISNDLIDPRNAGFDVAFHYRRLRKHGIIQQPVATLECGLFATPDYIAKHGLPAHPDQLTAHQCLGYSYQGAVETWNVNSWAFTKDNESVNATVELAVQASSSHILKKLALAGLGLAILPVIRALPETNTNHLVRVLPDWQPPTLELQASYPREQKTSARLTALINAVRTHIASNSKISPEQSQTP